MIKVYKIKWPVKSTVHAITTTRIGGFSQGVYAGLNLANHVEDETSIVKLNRELLTGQLNFESEPKWLNQTHSTKVVVADQVGNNADADGSYTTQDNCICAILTADCLPVFIADTDGQCVGVFHAGWRGLANGILKNAVSSMQNHSNELIAAIGPAISQPCFEVGSEVKEMFLANAQTNEQFFADSNKSGHFYADLYGLAKQQLIDSGVESVWFDDAVCTFKDSRRFYSYRRDGQTGRMASLIWISR